MRHATQSSTSTERDETLGFVLALQSLYCKQNESEEFLSATDLHYQAEPLSKSFYCGKVRFCRREISSLCSTRIIPNNMLFMDLLRRCSDSRRGTTVDTRTERTALLRLCAHTIREKNNRQIVFRHPILQIVSFSFVCLCVCVALVVVLIVLVVDFESSSCVCV